MFFRSFFPIGLMLASIFVANTQASSWPEGSDCNCVSALSLSEIRSIYQIQPYHRVAIVNSSESGIVDVISPYLKKRGALFIYENVEQARENQGNYHRLLVVNNFESLNKNNILNAEFFSFASEKLVSGGLVGVVETENISIDGTTQSDSINKKKISRYEEVARLAESNGFTVLSVGHQSTAKLMIQDKPEQQNSAKTLVALSFMKPTQVKLPVQEAGW